MRPVCWIGPALEVGLVFGLVIGLTGLAYGQAGVSYVALLLCTRGWFGTPALPWRLGRFLHWCYHAGLIRQAGIGYQFRHRELQDHLAHHPQPAQVSGQPIDPDSAKKMRTTTASPPESRSSRRN